MQQTLNTTLLIIGGGPGGYVAAIRAGQLGIPTVLIEGHALGGTCLNIGCIPSKALIHVAEQFHQTHAHSQHSALGINVSAPTLDITQSVAWKDGIVDRLTSGVAALLKKHGVKVIHGWARILDGKTVEVDGQDLRVQCEHLLLATGSSSVELPMLPLGGPRMYSTRSMLPSGIWLRSGVPATMAAMGRPFISIREWLELVPRMKRLLIWPRPPRVVICTPGRVLSRSVRLDTWRDSISARSITTTGASTELTGCSTRLAVTTMVSLAGREDWAKAAVGNRAAANNFLDMRDP